MEDGKQERGLPSKKNRQDTAKKRGVRKGVTPDPSKSKRKNPFTTSSGNKERKK